MLINHQEDLPAGFAIAMIIILGLLIAAFVSGRYTAEKDIKAKFHMHDCTISDTWSACHDGLTEQEKADMHRFVEKMQKEV